MTDQAIIERLHRLIGRDCRYLGRPCRVIDVLGHERRLVLEAREATPPIQADQYGQAVSRSNEIIELPLFDQNDDLSEDLMLLLDALTERH